MFTRVRAAIAAKIANGRIRRLAVDDFGAPGDSGDGPGGYSGSGFDRWSAGLVTGIQAQSDEEALFGINDPGVEQTVLTSRGGLSRDEVFNIVVDRNYEVKGK